MSSVVLLSYFTVCSLTFCRHILQKPLGFVLCVKTLCKTYQGHLWGKLEGSCFLWPLLTWGHWSCQDPQVQALSCACLACNIQDSAAACDCQQLQNGSNISIHTFWEENVEIWCTLNTTAIQSSELKTQEEISLKKKRRRKMPKSPSVLGGFFYKLMSSSKLEMNSTVKEARKWLSGYFHKNTTRSYPSFWKRISAVISYRLWRISVLQTCEKKVRNSVIFLTWHNRLNNKSQFKHAACT